MYKIHDNHLHSNFSIDSKNTMEDIIKFYDQENRGCTITDHFETKKDSNYRYNIEKYFKQNEKYRNENIKLGIELGYCPGQEELLKEVSKDMRFDFITYSNHLINGESILDDSKCDKNGMHPISAEMRKYRMDEIVKIHYEETYLSLSLIDFDALSHIDFVSRYMLDGKKYLDYKTYQYEIDKILKYLIINDKSLELNTKGLNDEKSLEYRKEIFKAYKDLGGKYITLSSDAHNPDEFQRNFQEALAMTLELGLTPCYYENRKRIALPFFREEKTKNTL